MSTWIGAIRGVDNAENPCTEPSPDGRATGFVGAEFVVWGGAKASGDSPVVENCRSNPSSSTDFTANKPSRVNQELMSKSVPIILKSAETAVIISQPLSA